MALTWVTAATLEHVPSQLNRGILMGAWMMESIALIRFWEAANAKGLFWGDTGASDCGS